MSLIFLSVKQNLLKLRPNGSRKMDGSACVCFYGMLHTKGTRKQTSLLDCKLDTLHRVSNKNLASLLNKEAALNTLVKLSDIDKPNVRGRHSLVGPSARNLLHHYGIDPSIISPSGPHNVILKSDVLNYIQKQNVEPKSDRPKSTSQQPAGSGAIQAVRRVKPAAKEKFKDHELSNMRKTIAKRLTLSKTTIPHAYMSADCAISEVAKVRQNYKRNNIKTSVNDFIVKASALALKQVKEVNVLFDEQKGAVQYLPNVDIAIAVATDSGLITPIIRDANRLDVPTIGSTVKQLADKARQGKLQPHEFQGGTFSISNLGMFGIAEFSAVINPPQSAILAVGSSRFIVQDDDSLQQVFSVTLSYDARAINEESAAKFLEIFRTFIESPENLEKYGDGSDLRRLSFLEN